MTQKFIFISSLFFSFMTSAATLDLKAIYVVPEKENENIPEASRSFAVDYTVLQNGVGSEVAIFDLPQELTGRVIKIELKVVQQEVVNGIVVKTLVGPLGEAKCIGPWAQTQCRYQMEKLDIDANEVEHHLATKFPKGSSRFNELKTLSGRFSGDPIGEILVVPSTLPAATGFN